MIRTVGLLVGPPTVSGKLDVTSMEIRDVLREGYEVTTLHGGPDLFEQLQRHPVDLIFNNFSGGRSRREQAAVCALMELLNIPYTGSDARAQLLGLHKDLAKKILTYHGISTPRFVTLCDPEQRVAAGELTPPLIVKPGAEGSSVGISPDSVGDDPHLLLEAARQILQEHGAPAIMEEYICGREFSVGVLGNDPPVALPPVEVDFGDESGFYTYQVKAGDVADTIHPFDLTAETAEALAHAATATFSAIGCSDYARVDVRLSSDGTPYVLEINTLPGLRPGYSDFPKAARAAGLSYREMIFTLVDLCLRRTSRPGDRGAAASNPTGPVAGGVGEGDRTELQKETMGDSELSPRQ